jgi:excisionase family DNA binding protein
MPKTNSSIESSPLSLPHISLDVTPALSVLIKAVADEVARMLNPEFAWPSTPTIQPALMDVKQAGVYLGRSMQSIQHLILERELPVVRVGRRVHLHRPDLDAFIEKNKY